jgi:hypothetical protein
MSELPSVNLSEMFNMPLPSTQERLGRSYQDPVVHERVAEIMRAPDSDRAGLKAQLDTYLAAAYALFPEESQVIHDSLEGSNSDG